MEKNNSMKAVVVAVLIGVLGLAGFAIFSGGDDDTSTDTASQAAVEVSDNSDFPLDISFNNLEPLSEGIYEGWVVRGDDKHSFGTFNTNENSEVIGEFALDGITPENGDTVVVTIEPVPDADPEPSATVILAGDVVDGATELAFPVDVTAFAGQYFLATPTDEDDTNETAGVWFINPETGGASLDIPVAPAGWIYEGWIVANGTPLSTGSFTDPAMADNLIAYYSGEGPDKPGEDFLENLPEGFEAPLDLAADGETLVVISLEPYQDGTDPTGPAPAQVKPLTAMIAAGAPDHELLDLNVSDETVPSGSASLR